MIKSQLDDDEIKRVCESAGLTYRLQVSQYTPG